MVASPYQVKNNSIAAGLAGALVKPSGITMFDAKKNFISIRSMLSRVR